MSIPARHPTPQPSAGPRLARARLGTAAWAVLVAALLWLPNGGGPSSWLPLRKLGALAEAGGDKVVHAALFAGQAWLLCRSRESGRGWLAASFVLALGYGALTEVGQLLVPGRDAGFADGAADAVGAALGIAFHVRSNR